VTTDGTTANNNGDGDDCSTKSTIAPLGRWSRVLADVGRERVALGATSVYKILQAALAPVSSHQYCFSSNSTRVLTLVLVFSHLLQNATATSGV
jgi:hypothetical protein